MNVAVFSGAFDPPHKGHVSVIQQIVSLPDVDKLCIVVNPAKHGKKLLPKMLEQECLDRQLKELRIQVIK